jgi:hypothetical protein
MIPYRSTRPKRARARVRRASDISVAKAKRTSKASPDWSRQFQSRARCDQAEAGGAGQDHLYVLNCYYAMRFVRDENKSRTNLSKHGITFAAAAKVFDNPRTLSFPERLVEGEQR